MTNPHLATGSIWRLHHDGQEIARLSVTGTEMFWVHADIETLPGFEPFQAVFAEQERAAEAEDWERADACYSTSMATAPRWHDEPFSTKSDSEGDEVR